MADKLLHSDPAGMDVIDLLDDVQFAQRPPRARDVVREIESLQRLAYTFANNHQHVFRELAAISMELCGADSAGISVEEPSPTGGNQFRWIATAGAYAPFVNQIHPGHLAPATTCLIRNRPQILRVSKVCLNALGFDAPPVTDGILIPWRVNGIRGTVWCVAHTSDSLFDLEDYRVLQSLADFAAIAVRYQAQQEKLTQQAAAAAAAAMAHELAHRINNPLQSLMNTVFLASQGGTDSKVFVHQATEDLRKLSALVNEILYISNHC